MVYPGMLPSVLGLVCSKITWCRTLGCWEESICWKVSRDVFVYKLLRMFKELFRVIETVQRAATASAATGYVPLPPPHLWERAPVTRSEAAWWQCQLHRVAPGHSQTSWGTLHVSSAIFISLSLYIYIHIYIYRYSSSTAQGGGGSFKDRTL